MKFKLGNKKFLMKDNTKKIQKNLDKIIERSIKKHGEFHISDLSKLFSDNIIKDIEFNNIHFNKSDWGDTEFHNCTFRNVHFENILDDCDINFEHSKFHSCKFINTKIIANLNYSNFMNCEFIDSSLILEVITFIEFNNNSMINSRLRVKAYN